MDKDNPSIQTFTGKTVYFLRPDARVIDARDIARSLSMQCRFNGHVKGFYSVAEHSLLLARLLREREYPHPVQLQGLLHDAAETYFGDIVYPVKHGLYWQTAAVMQEQEWKKAIYSKFGVSSVEDPAVEEGHKTLFNMEWVEVFTTNAERINRARWRPESWVQFLRPEDAEREYRRALVSLSRDAYEVV